MKEKYFWNNIDDLLWEYIGVIRFMEDNPGFYGTDEKRAKLHKKIIEYFSDIPKEAIDRVAHNMPSDIDPEMFIRFARDEKQHREYLWERDRLKIR